MKAAKPVILILTTRTGGGHINLAQSLKEMLATNYEVVIMNAQSSGDERWYAWVSRHFLPFLHWQFVWSDNKVIAFLLHLVLTTLSFRRLHTIIELVQPQLIITTHAFISYATARANDHGHKRVPLVFQLTDLGCLHMTWFTEKRADAYLAPTREIFAQALKQGIGQERLYLTGRPVRHQFIEALSNNDTLATLGFDPSILTIFLQGGAKGSAAVDRIIQSMLGAGVPVQIILAAGNNEKMALQYASNKQIYVLPFTEKIAMYMAAAHVIAGKAGASFISEAFMLEKPFLVTAFIAGQETHNLSFIEKHNLGWVCLRTATQRELLVKIANNPKMISEKMESIRAYKAWNQQANQHTCAVIDRLLS